MAVLLQSGAGPPITLETRPTRQPKLEHGLPTSLLALQFAEKLGTAWVQKWSGCGCLLFFCCFLQQTGLGRPGSVASEPRAFLLYPDAVKSAGVLLGRTL